MRLIDARGCFFVGWSCCLCAGVVFLCGELFSRQSCFFAGVALSTGVVFFVEVLCAALFFARELFFYARSCLLGSYCLREELFFARESCFFTRGVVCSGVIVCARSYSLRERVVFYAGSCLLRELLFARGVILCAKELFLYARSYLLGSYCLRGSYSRQVGNILRVKMFAGRAYCGSPSLPKVGGDSPAMSGDK